MKLSVIIPAYNRAATLRTTLESLIAQTFEKSEYEIVVVDNKSTDNTPDAVKEVQARSPVAITYLYEGRAGVHYARNLGAMHAKGRVLYFTDDDMIAERDMLAALYRMFELDARVAVATGRVLPKWEVDPPEWITRYCLNGLLSLQFREEDLLISSEDPGVWSCHEAIRKDVLISCGGFPPENTGGEWVGDGESGLNARVRERGHKFAFTAAAVTHHVIPAGRLTQAYLNRRHENQGNADAYTWFRATRPDERGLAQQEKHCRKSLTRARLTALSQRAKRRLWWHMAKGQVSYWEARLKYTRRLRRDASWREFVLQDNWIADARPAT
jgi:glycosyltransferase involved in cell wall biosynthesis